MHITRKIHVCHAYHGAPERAESVCTIWANESPSVQFQGTQQVPKSTQGARTVRKRARQKPVSVQSRARQYASKRVRTKRTKPCGAARSRCMVLLPTTGSTTKKNAPIHPSTHSHHTTAIQKSERARICHDKRRRLVQYSLTHVDGEHECPHGLHTGDHTRT